MIRTLTIFLLALAVTAGGAAAKKNKSKQTGKAELAVTRFLLMQEGAVKTSRIEANKDGEPIWTGESVTTILPGESIEYIPVSPRRTVRTIRLPGGETREWDITRFQWIKAVISCRFAYVIGDGDRVMDECRYIDLEGPATKDHAWEFKSTRLEPEPAIATGLLFDYRSRVGRADMNLTIGTQAYTDCLTVTTTGRAATEGTDTCADGSTATGTVETTSTRWLCPGIGPIKEVTSVRLKSGEKLCTEYRYEELLNLID